MAGVFWSPDRVWRIETISRHGHQIFRVYYAGRLFAHCRDLAELARVLSEAGLSQADLIED